MLLFSSLAALPSEYEFLVLLFGKTILGFQLELPYGKSSSHTNKDPRGITLLKFGNLSFVSSFQRT